MLLADAIEKATEQERYTNEHCPVALSHEVVRLLIAAASRQLRQPIATAPKDGTLITAFNTQTGVSAIVGVTEAEDGPMWTDIGDLNAMPAVQYNLDYFDRWKPL